MQARKQVSHRSRAIRSKVAAWVALLGLFAGSTYAQPPPDPMMEHMGSEMARYGICSVYGCNDTPGPTTTHIDYGPCFRQLNAMRPCDLEHNVPKPVGVDPNLVGTWEIPLEEGPWILEIRGDGNYKFRSEAGDHARSHSGKFSAGNGHWTLTATTGEADSGLYLYQAPDTWIATGKLGAAAWRREAAGQAATALCAPQSLPASQTHGVDPNLVGTWEFALKGGPWVWEILRNGTYKFHSEAGDNVPPHTGTFSAAKGKWSLTATNGYSDTGPYLFQPPDIWIATGRLGTGAWHRPASSAVACSKKAG